MSTTDPTVPSEVPSARPSDQPSVPAQPSGPWQHPAAGAPPAGTVLPPPQGGPGGPGAPRRPRWPVVLLVVGVVVSLVTGLAGLAVVRRLLAGASDAVVAYVPADAVLYSHLNLRPSAGNLVGLASLAARLEEATGEPLLDPDRIADEVDGEDGPSWELGIRPWLGSQAGAFVLAPPAGAAVEETDAALVVLVSDRAGAEAFVAENVTTSGSWDAGEGAQGWEVEGGEAVLALTDDLLVVGTPGGVAASLAVDGDSLAGRAEYTELVDALPASVATTWVDAAAAVEAVRAGAGGGLDGLGDLDAGVDHAAFGLSLRAGAVDVTSVARPSAAAATPDAATPVAAESVAQLPSGGLAYVRVPDLGRELLRTVDAADAGAEGLTARQEADEALAPLGTDLATVAGWLGDVVATVSYDPTRESDNLGVLVRAGVSDDAAAASLVDALVADVPDGSGLEVAPGSVTAGSASLSAGDGRLTLSAGELGAAVLADDAAYQDAVEGLDGDVVAYLDVAGLVRAVAPVALDGSEPSEEDVRALQVLGAFDRLVATGSRGDDGLLRGVLRLSWGQPLQPLDTDAATYPPDVDLGALDQPGGLLGAVPEPDGLAGLEDLEGVEGLEGLDDLEGLGGAAAAAYGDDPALDALWDACGAGDMAACDELFLSSGFGTEYESFALTCGGRTEGDTFGCEGAVEP